MSLDVFVMPLWRFKAGYFESPLETKLGLKPRIASLAGIYSLPYHWHWLRSYSARREVRSIKTAVAAQTGAPVDWKDDGPVLYSERPGGFEDLRAYAKWLDYRDRIPEFTAPEDRDFYKHEVWGLKDVANLSCPHLVKHDCYSGYFLPCDFRQIAEVEPYEAFGQSFKRPVGSSFQLRQELDLISKHLQLNVREWYDDKSAHEGFVEINGRSHIADPHYYVKWGFAVLQEASKLSCEHGLPIIFWG
jgi:hypothetical protein